MEPRLRMRLHDLTSDPVLTMVQMIELLKQNFSSKSCLCHVVNDVMGCELRFNIDSDEFLTMLGITREDVQRLTPELATDYDSAWWFRDRFNPAPRIEYLTKKINEINKIKE